MFFGYSPPKDGTFMGVARAKPMEVHLVTYIVASVETGGEVYTLPGHGGSGWHGPELEGPFFSRSRW